MKVVPHLQRGANDRQHVFCNDRAHAVANLAETMPFGFVECKPIWKTLQPGRFAGSNHPWFNMMYGANCLITSSIAPRASSERRAKTARVKPYPLGNRILLSRGQLGKSCNYFREMSRAHATGNFRLLEQTIYRCLVTNSRWNGISKMFGKMSFLHEIDFAPSTCFGLPSRVDKNWQAF